MGIYRKAAKGAYRFNTSVGPMSVEQLFTLPLKSGKVSLDSVGRVLQQEILDSKTNEIVSLVDPTSSVDNTQEELQTKLAILKDIISDRMETIDASNKRAAAASELKRMRDLLAEKRDDSLRNLSEDELKARIAELQKIQ